LGPYFLRPIQAARALGSLDPFNLEVRLLNLSPVPNGGLRFFFFIYRLFLIPVS